MDAYSWMSRSHPPVAVPSNISHSWAFRYVLVAGEPLYTCDEHEPVTSVFVTVTYSFTTGQTFVDVVTVVFVEIDRKVSNGRAAAQLDAVIGPSAAAN